MKKELKITKGVWSVKPDFREPKVFNESGKTIFTHRKDCYDGDTENNVYYSHNKMIANAELMAEAGTITNKCGYTPSQLLKQRDMLLDALKKVDDLDLELHYPGFNDETGVEKAINQIEE